MSSTEGGIFNKGAGMSDIKTGMSYTEERFADKEE